MTWKRIVFNFFTLLCFFFIAGTLAKSLESKAFFDLITVISGLFLMFRIAAPVLLTMAYFSIEDGYFKRLLERNFCKRFFLIGEFDS